LDAAPPSLCWWWGWRWFCCPCSTVELSFSGRCRCCCPYPHTRLRLLSALLLGLVLHTWSTPRSPRQGHHTCGLGFVGQNLLCLLAQLFFLIPGGRQRQQRRVGCVSGGVETFRSHLMLLYMRTLMQKHDVVRGQVQEHKGLRSSLPNCCYVGSKHLLVDAHQF